MIERLWPTGGPFKSKRRKGRERLARRTNKNPVLAVLIAALAIGAHAAGQESHTTIRHHRIEEQDPVTAKLAEAEADLEKRDYAKAESLLKEVVEAHADSYAGWYDLGYLYHTLGRREDSIAAYRKSVAHKPDLFESNLNLGLELADSQPEEAEGYLRAATKLKPAGDVAEGHKRAWLALGHLLENNKPEEALGAIHEAALADPKDQAPHLLAGALLEKQQRPQEAEKEYQEALAIAPQSPDALTALTNVYMRQHEFVQAESLLRKLVELHPNDASAHLQLGRMLAIAGKNDEAVAEMEMGLRLDPSDSKAERDLADLYLDSGKYQQAEKLYKTLLASYPNDADLNRGLGRALLREKKFNDAEQQLLKAVELKPDFGPAYGDLAVAANENQDYAMAIKAVDLRAKYMPEIPVTYFLRATAYDHLHDAKQAAAYYHQFLNVAGGKYPDQEWQARHRLIAIEPKK